MRVVAGAGWRSWMTAFFCRFRGIPPNLATSGFLPGRSTLAWKHVRFPYGVSILAWYLSAIVVIVVRCLAASVLSMEVLATHSSRFSLRPPEVGAERLFKSIKRF